MDLKWPGHSRNELRKQTGVKPQKGAPPSGYHDENDISGCKQRTPRKLHQNGQPGASPPVPPDPSVRRLDLTSPTIQNIGERTQSEGGGSVSVSKLQDLSIYDDSGDQQRTSPPNAGPKAIGSNKRPPGNPGDGAPPAKYRSGIDGSLPRGPSQNTQRSSPYDPARDQRPPLTIAAPKIDPCHHSPPNLFSSPRSPPQKPRSPSRSNIRSPILSHSAPFETEKVIYGSPSSSPTFNALSEKDSSILLQPETRPITQEQLVNEVKGIYQGLVLVEKKCVEIDQEQSMTTNKLSNEQWQALIALHRTLLHEHHDFFLASQHPSASPALRRLATKYAMPARMWRHGIHSFLELLRHRLPDSLDHMLAFIYLAYSMMALLMESVPTFEETWIECLGDLARYRMAIEEADLRDREVWSGVARMWYNKAADKSPDVGRIQHHLAVLARPNIVRQQFYYSKALICVIPFPNARESIMLLYNPFLEGSEITSQRYPLVESTLVKANGLLFTHGSIREYDALAKKFVSVLDGHIGRVTAKFRVQGPEIASTLCAATFDFGVSEAYLSQAFRTHEEHLKARRASFENSTDHGEAESENPKARMLAMRFYWASVNETADQPRATPYSSQDPKPKDATFSDSLEAAAHGLHTLSMAIVTVFQRIGDKNTLPFAHVILAYLFSLAFVPGALVYVEGYIPWESLTIFLNTLGRSGVVEARFEGSDFPQPLSGSGRQLPEDFIMRGLVWSQYYHPKGFFEGQVVDEDERTLELPSHAPPRAERCLWLGIRLASLKRWLHYDPQTKQFSITDFARTLEAISSPHTLDSRSQTMSVERDLDTTMMDV